MRTRKRSCPNLDLLRRGIAAKLNKSGKHRGNLTELAKSCVIKKPLAYRWFRLGEGRPRARVTLQAGLWLESKRARKRTQYRFNFDEVRKMIKTLLEKKGAKEKAAQCLRVSSRQVSLYFGLEEDVQQPDGEVALSAQKWVMRRVG